MKISATIITYNEERNLPRAIESLRCADEIVVIDSGSTDRTVEIAQKLGARVVESAWLGYAKQKNFAAEQAAHDWILSLDADESLSEALEAEIWRVKKQGPQYDAYTMPRQARYLGRWIRHSGWYPDRKVRLYHRSKARWVGDFVHESVKVEGSLGHLDSNLLHFTCDSLSEHLRTMDRYTTLAAEQLIEAGEKVTWGRLIFEPPWTFFRTYFVKLGFLDGVEGLAIANLAALYNFLKYAKVRFMSPGDSVRTLHVDTGRELRGGQWQALYLIERLSDAVLLARAGSPLFAEAQRRKVDVRALSFRALAACARQSDLVHVHDARAHTMAALAGIAPLIVSRRVAFPVKRGFLSGRKYARATLYLAVSNYVAARLMDVGVPGEKIRVVYDGVPIPAPGRPQHGRVVALASKPVEIPGVSVELTTDLWRDLSTASVFVYKSDLEGLGSAALAAMACGVPVVASAVGGLPEVVEDGKTGFLVADGDFAKPVRRLLEDAALAAEMSRAGRERMEREFSVEGMVEKTMRAYREVLG